MRIVFFGTPDYVIPVLESLNKTFKDKSGESPIVAVVTQKPQASGRKQLLEYSPVDSWAHKRKIPIFFNAEDLIKEGIDADVAILESYGNILSKRVIDHFPKGIVNIHPSLLPRWRGASPVQATIISGDNETGGTAILLDEEVDHGPILSTFKEDILPEDTTESLRRRIFEKAADFLTALLPAYTAGKVHPKEQDHRLATYTTRVKKEDAFIPLQFLNANLQGLPAKEKWKIPFMKDFTTDASPPAVHNFIRAMQPWPIAWTEITISDKQKDIRRLKILSAHLETDLITSRLLLIPDLVQLEGKNPVSWEQFKEGYPNASLS